MSGNVGKRMAAYREVRTPNGHLAMVSLYLDSMTSECRVEASAEVAGYGRVLRSPGVVPPFAGVAPSEHDMARAEQDALTRLDALIASLSVVGGDTETQP